MKTLSADILLNLTTVQRDDIVSPSAGMVIFNSTTGLMNTYDGSTWIVSEILPQYYSAGMYMYVNGSIPPTSRVALQVVDIETTLPIGVPGSKAFAYIPPTSQTDFNIIREANGNYGTKETIGTISFPSTSNGGITITTEVVLGVGDLLYLESPANTNAMADLFVNIRGKSLINSY